MNDPQDDPSGTADGVCSTPDLLAGIIDELPVGLSVADASGRFILVNQFAAWNATWPSEARAAPPNYRKEHADERRQRASALLQAGQPVVAEERVQGRDGQRTLLTSYKPVRVRNQHLLISTSIDITERKQFENELARRAYFDELTGLPNRAFLEERIDDLLQHSDPGHRFALAFIDLDNFKHINDYYSHAVGDALLVKVARRIASQIGPDDMLARISGDEFVLVLDPVTSELALRETVHRISNEIRHPIYIESFEVLTSASIGVSIYPDHGTNYEVLRRNADNAMYRVKSRAKGGVQIYDLEMGRAVAERMELEQRLRLAIRDRSFRCAFQPKIDIHTREVVGAEALIRWCDENGVISPPGDFIALAVELGLIDEITRFVLAECVRSLDQIDEAFGPDTTISINVAAKQACDLNFMYPFAEALVATGCAERLMIEITEDAFVAKSRFQNTVLPLLRNAGVRVSIDDFGTGYSSLAALADITADEVKVDRSFITDIHERPRSQSILRTIESLSQALGMSVVVEGIESVEELTYIQETTSIRYAQGYYFAKPLYLDEIVHRRRDRDDRRFEMARERPETRVRVSRAFSARW
jgi:cyclic di-GMP phosphodiesterase Gmr